jgi:hypothetical protein
MSREIKFRAYSIHDSDWIRDGRGEIAVFGPTNTLGNIYKPSDLIVQQYTGIKDKNGKELFEGDVVEYLWEAWEHHIERSHGEIFFDEGIFYFGRQDELAMNDGNFLSRELCHLMEGVTIE